MSCSNDFSFMCRFLSKMTIARTSFQLLGAAAMFIAAKYEEIYPPDVNEFVYITDESYDKEQVLKMEMLILKVGFSQTFSVRLLIELFNFYPQTLEMNVSTPTTHYFLRRLTSMTKPPATIAAMAEYLCYLSMLQGGSLLKFYPSEIALSSLILAAHTLEEEECLRNDVLTQTLQSMTDSLREFDEEATKEDVKDRLNECMSILLEVQKAAGTTAQKAAYDKYSLPKYFAVAKAECMESAPQLN